MVKHEDGFTYITYRDDKRPLKLAVYFLRGSEDEAFLYDVVRFVRAGANAPQHLAKMEPPKLWALVERLSTLFCRSYSPTSNWGVTKPEIRGAVLFVIDAGLKAGNWPDEYEMTRKTFVQKL
jgi:hypothetical protein